MLSPSKMRPDQIEAARWLSSRTECFVPAPIGWGKTIVTLTAINRIRHIYGPWRTLVISTKNIVEHTWPAEIEKWEHLRHLSYASAAGRDREAVLSRPDVLGLNFENVEWFYDLVDADPTLRPEILVIDESHHMKGFGANRVKRHCGFTIRGKAGKLRKPGHVHHYKRRFALSGTLNPEGYADMWPQEACISMRRRMAPNITMFRRDYCATSWTGEREVYTVHRDGERRIERALAPITYKGSLGRYLDVPDPVFSTIHVPWAPGAWDEYCELKQHFVLDLRDRIRTVDPDAQLEYLSFEQLVQRGLASAVAPNEGVLLSKLRQAGSGFVYDAQKNARLLTDPFAKLEALEELRERTAGVPLLVFTQFEAEDQMIAERFPDATIGMPKNLDEWNARRIPMLVVHPESAGEGLNLQFGSHIAVFYNLPWSGGIWKQAWGRLHRGGQTRQCSIVRFERPGSVDEYVWSVLQGKGETMDRFQTNVTR